ncbi:SDR family NAD(P)-dependent oxidoreductase [Dinghuibacter silviterrae]|uniref:NAD(P)-dependent dehydrogenase (Short-subunit alcohol dehydrogenase family) n=1 Tax=Dinghuibacter silviterrae TaxID=1539049 RepID=A0A4R8DUJ0_9BACT|nr:SDR family oxidoreductase [Dinghuibacter silviterrae]TDX01588.1 NAD(P)-dependent dehydrogenase (short-subunit alcohol dehydrogenase family) [Dinghuibacter silviterrae]
MDKSQQTAIVTGGGSGIGKAIAESFMKAGIHTVILGRDLHKLKTMQDRWGGLCTTLECDLTRLDTLPAVVARIEALRGRIDILVNNAGINMKKDFTEVTDTEFQGILLTNVTAVFALSREVVKVMLKHGAGAILNISSMASQYGIPKVTAYTASKAAIEGMTRSMAIDLSPLGIRVNCIAPGFIRTDMSAKALDQDAERKQKVLSRTPMGNLGEPSDIGEAALFLCSEGARYITGVVLPVDGGNSVGF